MKKAKELKIIEAFFGFKDYSEKCRNFRSLMRLLHDEGYSSQVMIPLHNTLEKLATEFSVDKDRVDLFKDNTADILNRRESGAFLLIKEHEEPYVPESKGGGLIALEICCLAPNEKVGKSETEGIIKVIKEKAEITLDCIAWESLDQQQAKEKTKEMVKGLSTNGKLLMDEDVKAVCRVLRNKNCREVLMALTRLSGSLFALDATEYLQETTGLRKDSIEKSIKTLSHCGAILPQLRLRCKECNFPSSGFSSSTDLEQLEGKLFCPRCGNPYDFKRKAKTFSLTENGRHSVNQGLWLEEYVADMLKTLGCVNIKCGAIIDTLEVDTLALKYGKAILVECKAGDVSFTDLTIFSHKIRTIEPDHAIIVTTSEVLPNAKKEIESIKQREKIEIVQIEGSLKQIKKKLEKTITKIEKTHLETQIRSILLAGIFGKLGLLPRGLGIRFG